MTIKFEQKLKHYVGKAIVDYNMIQAGDRILVCLSGGKDSFTMLNILRLIQKRAKVKFTIHVLVLAKGIPGWNEEEIRSWLLAQSFAFTILKTDIFKVVQEKERQKDSYCVLCSRLRRGHIYTFAKNNDYNKVALGHHRDDLIASLLMSIFYNGVVSSMPPKLLTNDKKLIVIRPLVYCQEADIIEYAKSLQFPVTPKGLCGAKESKTRQQIGQLVRELATFNKKIPMNIMCALRNVRPSQLMDKDLYDFKKLESLLHSLGKN